VIVRRMAMERDGGVITVNENKTEKENSVALLSGQI